MNERGGTRAVMLFMAAGLVAVLVIALLGYGVVRRTATDEAIRDARDLTEADARIASPLLTDELLAGDGVARHALDRAVHNAVLSDRVVRVKVWAPDGTIVYSDDERLIGRTFELGEAEQRALRTGHSHADLSDLDEPENRDERSYGKLLEVYVGTDTPSGRPFLFELYQRFDVVAADRSRVLRSFAPALIGGLLALWLAQLPLAFALARRIRAGHERERELLARAIESSEQERRRIAADLHDSVVEGLAGSSMSLSALAGEAQRSGEPGLAASLQEQAGALRQWIRELRTFVVSIAPPKLHEEGLATALGDLLSTASARGLDTRLLVDKNLKLGRTAEALVFRGALEGLRNVLTHAAATNVALSVANGTATVRLTVTDDGVGFDGASLPERVADGHVGLHLLGELAADAGGELRIESKAGEGTRLVLEVPAR